MDTQPHLHGQTDELFKRLRKLSGRLTGLAGEIYGNATEQAGANAKTITRTVHDKIAECHGLVQLMEETVSRLESSIGGNIDKPMASAAGY